MVSQYTKNPETDTEYFLSEDTIFYKFLNELDLPKAWDLEFTINIKTLLDMIIMAIKDYSISYQRKMLTDDTKKLKQLLDEYTEANVKLNLNPANQYLKIENDNRLEKYQDELKAQRQKSLYRTKFIEKLHGERTNRTLCSLDRAKASQRYIGILSKTLADRTTIQLKTQKEVDEEIYKYYHELFSKDNLPDDGKIENFIDPNLIPKLTDQQADEIELPFTETELKDVLRKTKNNSSPGPTGIPFTFYKIFWEDLKGLLLKVSHEVFRSKSLPQLQQLS